MKRTKVAIIGCGNLGSSILRGLLDEESFPAEDIFATERDVKNLKAYEGSGINITEDNRLAIRESEVIIMALKPYNILKIMEELKDEFTEAKHTLISVATGVTLGEIRGAIDKNIPVFRVMPNTAADVKASVTSYCTDSKDSEAVEAVEYIFGLVGSTIRLNEELMEAATVLGACGLAYVMRFIRAMIQGGIQIGLSSKVASDMVNQAVKGAATLLIERNEHPEFEIDKVTTPKGCTIKGLNEMAHNGFSSALIRGIVASYEEIK